MRPQRTVILLALAALASTPAAALPAAWAAGGDEPGEYLDRRTEIWNLFFRLMVVAFTIGAIVSGTIIWQVWRFRESNPNAKPTPYEEKGEW